MAIGNFDNYLTFFSTTGDQIISDWVKTSEMFPEEEPGFYQKVNASVNASIDLGSKIEDVLILLKKDNPELTFIYFGTQTGVHRSYPWHNYKSSYDPTTRGWFKRSDAVRDRVVWGTPYIDASGQGLVITGSKAVLDRSGGAEKLVGVIGIDIKITTLRDNILGFKVYNTGYSFLVDRSGNTIAHKNLEPSAGTDWTDDDLQNPITDYEGTEFQGTMERMIQGGSSVDVIERGNTTLFVGYHPISSTGFSFAVVADSEEVLKAVMETEETINEKRDDTMNTIFMLIAGAVVFVLVVGMILARKIVNPLKHLTQTALEVSEGELDQAIHILSRDEIGKLAKAFEKMVAALKKANIMIAREEHKGGDSTDTSSQESVRRKAKELLGVEAAGESGVGPRDAMFTQTAPPQNPFAPTGPPAPQEPLPVFAPVAPPTPPAPSQAAFDQIPPEPTPAPAWKPAPAPKDASPTATDEADEEDQVIVMDDEGPEPEKTGPQEQPLATEVRMPRWSLPTQSSDSVPEEGGQDDDIASIDEDQLEDSVSASGKQDEKDAQVQDSEEPDRPPASSPEQEGTSKARDGSIFKLNLGGDKAEPEDDEKGDTA